MYIDKNSGIMVKLVTHFKYNKPTEITENGETIILPLQTYHKELILEDGNLNGTVQEITPEILSDYGPICTANIPSGESTIFDSSWTIDVGLNLMTNTDATVNVSTTTFFQYPEIALGKTALKFIHINTNNTDANISGNLTVHYWPAELIDKWVLENLQIYAFDPENLNWTVIPSSMNISSRTVTAEIENFSVFALVGVNAPIPLPPEFMLITSLIYYDAFRDKGALVFLLSAFTLLAVITVIGILSEEKT